MMIKLLIVFSFFSLNLFSDIRVKEPIRYSGEKLGLGLYKDYKVSKDFYDFSKNKNLFPRIILEQRGVKSNYFGEDFKQQASDFKF